MKIRYFSLAPFIAWQQLSRPVNWAGIFGRSARLEIEIGFGNGEFLAQRAQAHPQTNFVGLELEWVSVQRALRRLNQAGISNVRLLQIDARIALERLVQPQSVAHIYTLFPCPWPKERHVKHRLFGHAFLQLLNSRLQPGGSAHLVTDHHPYMEWILEQTTGTGFDVQCAPIPPTYRTKYEQKWLDKGQEEFYDVKLYKQQDQPIPLIEDISLQTHRLDHFDPEAFPLVHERGPISVECKEFLFDPKRQRGMVWVFAIEESLTQNFWIEIVYYNRLWHIRPARGCSVIPTMSVQRALDMVRDAAQRTLHPPPAGITPLHHEKARR
jgi:tRNA (guanine-N7-)-methyltransferase